MNARQTFLIAVILTSTRVASADDELSRTWRARDKSVRERADAVNKAFTNATPVSVVVAALGTNYTLCGSSPRLWAGTGPEPANTFWLSYRFGKDEVTIGTSAVWGRDRNPLSCKFTGAGYSLRVRPSTEATNRVQPNAAPSSGR
jgi:hypothetical protein